MKLSEMFLWETVKLMHSGRKFNDEPNKEQGNSLEKYVFSQYVHMHVCMCAHMQKLNTQIASLMQKSALLKIT